MPHRARRTSWSSLVPMLLLLVTAVEAAFAESNPETRSFHFRDIHRDGAVLITGHFGIPVGQIVTIEGSRAKPSKVSNSRTLRFVKINGEPVPKPGQHLMWPPLIQIRNVDDLPEKEIIVAEGYELLTWRGDPNINWHLEVEFMITKVVSPDSLKTNNARP